MGVLILLVFGGIPIAIGAYLIWKIEKSLPAGELKLLRDERGNPVPGDDGKPLYIDEEGKLFGHKYVTRFMDNRRKKVLWKWYFLGFLWAMFENQKKR